MTQLVNYTGKQMALIRQTIAADCNQEEFDLYISAAKAYGLDVFRRQIVPIVFSKNDPARRKMSLVVTRDGLRVIAQRCGDYRPASEPAIFEVDKDLVSPTNPHGIISCTVKLWKQDKAGDWYPVAGQAHWDEFAPLKEEWAYDEKAGKRRPTGKMVLSEEGNWRKMARLMIQKCAEAQALRAGWPDQFSSLYVEEEMDAAKVRDMTASELADEAMQEDRMRAISGANAIVVQFNADAPLMPVPVGSFADRVVEWLSSCQTKDEAKEWYERNRHALREFYAKQPGDAHELKKSMEKIIEKLPDSVDAE